MMYGLYLSATGVLANSYRQDVIANNLANSETVGFKRDTALLRKRELRQTVGRSTKIESPRENPTRVRPRRRRFKAIHKAALLHLPSAVANPDYKCYASDWDANLYLAKTGRTGMVAS